MKKEIFVDNFGKLQYISKKEVHKRYPREKGGYKVIGALGAGLKNKVLTINQNGKDLDCYSVEFNKLLYAVDGYIEVRDNEYIAVVKAVWLKRLLLLLLLILLIGYFFIGFGPDLDPFSRKYKTDLKTPDIAEKQSIALPGYDDIKVKANTKQAYFALWNPEENPCYFKFTITLKSTGEKIYQSKLVPPGEAITTVKFSKQFSEGKYPITISIESFNIENYKQKMNGGEIDATIVAIS